MYNYGDKKDAAHSIRLAHRDWFLLHQREGEIILSYHDRFMSLTDMLEQYAGIFGLHSELIDQELSGEQATTTCQDANELQRVMQTARERYVVCAFILQAENKKNRALLEDLENAQAVGRGVPTDNV